MPNLVLSRTQARVVDSVALTDFGVPGLILMENAGRGAAELLLEQHPTGSVVILCGKGNNGGDGFVIARHLDNQGVQVMVLTFEAPEQLQRDAATNYQIVRKSGIPLRQLKLPDEVDVLISFLEESEWVVDALLGTGTIGPAHEPYLTVIQVINGTAQRVLAVDVPSGLHCDEGPVENSTVKATLTATFVALKTGLSLSEAQSYAGRVSVIDIGVPRRVLSKLLEN